MDHEARLVININLKLGYDKLCCLLNYLIRGKYKKTLDNPTSLGYTHIRQ